MDKIFFKTILFTVIFLMFPFSLYAGGAEDIHYNLAKERYPEITKKIDIFFENFSLKLSEKDVSNKIKIYEKISNKLDKKKITYIYNLDEEELKRNEKTQELLLYIDYYILNEIRFLEFDGSDFFKKIGDFMVTSSGVYNSYWFYENDKKSYKKLFDADKNTFCIYESELLEYVKYSDDKNVYFFPINSERTKVEMDVNNIKTMNMGNYFHDTKNYFFNEGINGINKIGAYSSHDKIKYLDYEVIIINNILYYKGNNQLNLNINIEKITNHKDGYLISDNKVFLRSYILQEIEGADGQTFRYIEDDLGSYYEDKNNIYKIYYGPGNFGIDEIIKKD